MAAVAPTLTVSCYEAWRAEDLVKTRELQRDILGFIPLMNTFRLPEAIKRRGFDLFIRVPVAPTSGIRSRMAIVKEVLRQLGHPITATVRSPLPQISEQGQQAVAEFISEHRLAHMQ